MSLRLRLAITFVAFFAVALIVLNIGTYLVVRQTLIGSLDDGLRLGSDLLQQDFNESNMAIRSYFGDQKRLRLSLSGFQASDLLIQVYQLDGTFIGASANMPKPLPIDQDRLQEVIETGEASRATLLVDGERVRELLTPLRFNNQVVGVLQMGRSMSQTDRTLQVLFFALLGGAAIVLLAAARGGIWLTKAAFKPIEQITETAQSIVRAEDLSLRVPLPEPNDELQRLTVTINDLLARMEALFGAQRRFVADVSHELRTPLAAMQGNLDVLSRGAARDPELLSESLSDMRSEVNRLIRMANDLLFLAQSDAGQQLRREPVELDTLLLEIHRELRPLAQGVSLRIGQEDQVRVIGDRDRIKQALLNLTINALQHTPAGGSVTLDLTQSDNMAHLSVTDTGSGIAPDVQLRIFERFFRGDRARGRNSGGAGLGLSIVKWVAEAHGGMVSVESEPGKGSTFTLSLPVLALSLETPHISSERLTQEAVL